MILKGDSTVLQIIILDRINSNALNIWDRKWVNCEVKIRLNGFVADFRNKFLIDDFQNFNDSITESLKDMSKPILFHSLEESIYLKGIIDISGQVFWEGNVIYPVGDGNKLIFRFNTELAQIDTLSNDLYKELKNFS